MAKFQVKFVVDTEDDINEVMNSLNLLNEATGDSLEDITVDSVLDRDTIQIIWKAEDIKSIRPWLTDEEVNTAMDKIAKTVERRSIEEGWDIIESALHMNGFYHNDGDTDEEDDDE